MTRLPLATALAGATALAVVTGPAVADVFVWAAMNGSGEFDNWYDWADPRPDRIPGADDDCIFGSSSAGTVNLRTIEHPVEVNRMTFAGGSYEFNISGQNDLQVGAPDDADSGLVVGGPNYANVMIPSNHAGGIGSVNFSSVLIANDTDSHGVVEMVSWRPINVAGALIVGRHGTGLLDYRIGSGPPFPPPLRAHSMTLGAFAAGQGTFTQWRSTCDVATELRIGAGGHGRIELARSTILATDAILGEGDHSSGSGDFDDSELIVFNTLRVGRCGSGLITAHAGSILTIGGDAILGLFETAEPGARSSGTIELREASTMYVGGSLILSMLGDSALALHEGSRLVVEGDITSLQPERARIVLDVHSTDLASRIEITGDFVEVPLRIEVPSDAEFGVGDSLEVLRVDGTITPGTIEIVADNPAHRYVASVEPNAIRLRVTTRADLNGDGATNLNDLVILLAHWGACTDATCPGDLDGDGETDFTDLLLLLDDWTP